MLKRYLSAKWLLRLSPLLLVIVAVIYLIFGRNTNAHRTIIPSSNPSQNQASMPADSSSSTSPNSSATSTAEGTNQKATAGSTAPGGQLTLNEAQTFVSNHYPGQNGTGDQEQSACNTTPGATCYIEFINGDVAKQLQAQTVGSDGSVLWNWNIQDAGLTSGSWTIKAVAQLNGVTKTVQDPRMLVIQ